MPRRRQRRRHRTLDAMRMQEHPTAHPHCNTQTLHTHTHKHKHIQTHSSTTTSTSTSTSTSSSCMHTQTTFLFDRSCVHGRLSHRRFLFWPTLTLGLSFPLTVSRYSSSTGAQGFEHTAARHVRTGRGAPNGSIPFNSPKNLCTAPAHACTIARAQDRFACHLHTGMCILRSRSRITQSRSRQIRVSSAAQPRSPTGRLVAAATAAATTISPSSTAAAPSIAETCAREP
jgi:hypothetical protein